MGGLVTFLIAAAVAVWSLIAWLKDHNTDSLLLAGAYAAMALLIIQMHRIQRRQQVTALYDADIWSEVRKAWPHTVEAAGYIRDTYGNDQVEGLLHNRNVQQHLFEVEFKLQTGGPNSILQYIDAAAEAAGVRKVKK